MPEKKIPVNPTGYNPPEESPKNGKIRVKLVTPLFEAFVMEADKVLVPALDGDIMILPNRAPIFFSLRPGRMVVYNQGQDPVTFFVSAGVCEVRRNLCPVMAWGARADKINPERIKKQLAMALKTLPTTNSTAKIETLSRIDFFEMILDEMGQSVDIDELQMTINSKENLKMVPEDLGAESNH